MASSEAPVRAYRIVAPRWAPTAFSGEGARKFGGRWNSPGKPVVYLADSRALAALEMLVHLTTPGSRAKPYVLIPVAIPGDLVEGVARMPDHPVATGDSWLASNRSPVLRVPSIVIPEESNYLLNPRHPEFPKIGIEAPASFRFDARL